MAVVYAVRIKVGDGSYCLRRCFTATKKIVVVLSDKGRASGKTGSLRQWLQPAVETPVGGSFSGYCHMAYDAVFSVMTPA